MGSILGTLCCGEVDLKEHDRRVSHALQKEKAREQRREERKQDRANKRNNSIASQSSNRRNTIQSLNHMTDTERRDSTASGHRRNSEAIDNNRRMSRRATIAPTLTIEMPSSESLQPDKVQFSFIPTLTNFN